MSAIEQRLAGLGLSLPQAAAPAANYVPWQRSGRQIVVEGVNRVYKHVKKGHPKSPQGGRLSIERPIDASNVQFYCSACRRGTRVGLRYTPEGRKERFCRKCNASAGVISPPRPRYATKKA